MTWPDKNGPAGQHTRPGLNACDTSIIQRHAGDGNGIFPRCELYRTILVDDLPARCPLRTADCLLALLALEDRAYQRLRARDRRGLSDLQRLSVCDHCCGRLPGNPHVQELRAQAVNHA